MLAFAYKEAIEDINEFVNNDVETGFIFAGLQGMIDPPRPEA